MNNSTTTLPAHDAPLWRRLTVLEPAVVRGLIGALVGLGLIWGIDLTVLGDQLAATADSLGAIVVLLTPFWIRPATTPTVSVVEQATPFGHVIAGPANNQVSEGVAIRKVDDIVRGHATSTGDCDDLAQTPPKHRSITEL